LVIDIFRMDLGPSPWRRTQKRLKKRLNPLLRGKKKAKVLLEEELFVTYLLTFMRPINSSINLPAVL